MPSHNSLVLLALLASACSRPEAPTSAPNTTTLPNGALHVRNDAPQWKEGAGWKVSQDLSFASPEEGDGFFQRVTALGSDAAGRIYILDGQSNTLQQYDASGKWIRQIGRRGGGPGEYSGAIGLAVRGDRIYIVDQTNVRISVLDTAGAFLTSHPRNFANMGTWKWEGGLDSAGTIYDLRGQFADTGHVWQLVKLGSDSFTVTDSFPWPTYDASASLTQKIPGGMRVQRMTLPNTPDLARVFDPRGYIWFGIGNKYEIVQRRLTGDTVRVIERAWTPTPMSDTTRAYVDSMSRSLRKDGWTLPTSLPSSVPAFDALVVDERGNLWVGPYARGDATWHVFDSTGTWLGPVTFPAPILQLRFTEGRYYGLTLDSLDIEHVVRGRVER